VRQSAFAGALFAALIAPAYATPLDLYVGGKYQAAMGAGAAQNTAAGFAVAARAALADAMMRDTPCLACLERAEGFARKAIALDSKLPEGHIYLAIALGYEARIVGAVTAQLKGLGQQAKSELDAALAMSPNNAIALAALGGWNVEIVRNGGERMARWVYGASAKEGLHAFHSAFKIMPENVAIRYQYALALSGYDLDDYRRDVEDSLSRACAGKATTAYESFAQRRARELLDVLKRNDISEYVRLVKRDQGYP